MGAISGGLAILAAVFMDKENLFRSTTSAARGSEAVSDTESGTNEVDPPKI
jgi:hypothetical protein